MASVKVTSSEFGRLPGGEVVTKYTLTNSKGIEVGIITYGAVCTSNPPFF